MGDCIVILLTISKDVLDTILAILGGIVVIGGAIYWLASLNIKTNRNETEIEGVKEKISKIGNIEKIAENNSSDLTSLNVKVSTLTNYLVRIMSKMYPDESIDAIVTARSPLQLTELGQEILLKSGGK